LISINIAFEDILSQLVMERILNFCGDFSVVTNLGGRGFGFLKNNAVKYNKAAHSGTSFFMLTDLDTARCPSALISEWLQGYAKADNFLFRVAVTEIEAWILADRKGVSQFLNVSLDLVPSVADAEKDPKRTLVKLAARSRSRRIRTDLVPRTGTTAQVGPNYNGTVGEFVRESWSIEEAMTNSPSLHRAVHRIKNFSSLNS
jgi:hypothetical protein